MSFNIRNSHARDKDQNKWPKRKELVYEVIRNYAPDILGLQEVNRFQLNDIKKVFPEYETVGMGSKGDSNGQFSSIHYSKKRFTLFTKLRRHGQKLRQNAREVEVTLLQ